MSDLERDLRALFRDKQAMAPAAKPVSEYLNAPAATSPRWQWVAVPAAVLVTAAMVVGIAGLSDQQGGGTSVTADGSSPDISPVQGRGPLRDGADVSCVIDYEADSVAQRAFAFDGTVTGVGSGTSNREGKGQLRLSAVTLDVNEWFKGGSAGTVTVDMIPPERGLMNSTDGRVSYEVGTRLLVSGEPRWGGLDPLTDPIAWGCGFTRYWDQETAEDWRAATSETLDVLVEDIELPSEVVRRARQLLGERYVDVSINADHSAYVVGVYRLDPGEAQDLIEQLSGPAPVKVVNRSVSAEAVEDLRNQIERFIGQVDTPVQFTLVGSDLAGGSVLVGVGDGKDLDEAASLVQSRFPDWETVAYIPGEIRLTTGSEGDPQIRIRMQIEGSLTSDG